MHNPSPRYSPANTATDPNSSGEVASEHDVATPCSTVFSRVPARRNRSSDACRTQKEVAL